MNICKIGQIGQYTLPETDLISVQRTYAAIVVGLSEEDDGVVDIVYCAGAGVPTWIGAQDVVVAARYGLDHTFRPL